MPYDGNGYNNEAYEDEAKTSNRLSEIGNHVSEDTQPARATWNNSVEFLMSCIALSIGFGNIWRFPFTAYENGGGAFLIPYVILLFLVGKPFYFIEMIIGQFSSSSSIKVWRLSPGFAGVGWAQVCSTVALATYYSALMALTLYYLIASFSQELPWAKCREEWTDECVDSGTNKDNVTSKVTTFDFDRKKSSAELYFTKVVLEEKLNIEDGIGYPSWKLTLCLLGSWTAVLIVIGRGIKSAGRASYFLAIFPYVIMICLMIRAVTLDGAVNGILFFVTPDWSKLLYPKVWYAAVTQCFFSLSVCFGAIITYSSHNEFRHNIYRDVMIITTLDTFTSMMAGCTIFGILGNLAHEMGVENINDVVKSGSGLAFISYPDAISKFDVLPQVFSVLFFVMMFVLGLGSLVGMTTGIVAVIKEQIPMIKHCQIAVATCITGFLISTIYVTPGGQSILTLVDYYGTSFVVFILASFEISGIVWIYGLKNFLIDIEFMLDMKPSMYWKICWLVVTPSILIVIFFYTMATLEPLTYASNPLPMKAQIAGVILLCFGIFQIPLWMIVALLKHRHLPPLQMLKSAFAPSKYWGPKNQDERKRWLIYKQKTSDRS